MIVVAVVVVALLSLLISCLLVSFVVVFSCNVVSVVIITMMMMYIIIIKSINDSIMVVVITITLVNILIAVAASHEIIVIIIIIGTIISITIAIKIYNIQFQSGKHPKAKRGDWIWSIRSDDKEKNLAITTYTGDPDTSDKHLESDANKSLFDRWNPSFAARISARSIHTPAELWYNKNLDNCYM